MNVRSGYGSQSEILSEAIVEIIFSDPFNDMTIAEVLGTLDMIKDRLLSTLKT